MLLVSSLPIPGTCPLLPLANVIGGLLTLVVLLRQRFLAETVVYFVIIDLRGIIVLHFSLSKCLVELILSFGWTYPFLLLLRSWFIRCSRWPFRWWEIDIPGQFLRSLLSFKISMIGGNHTNLRHLLLLFKFVWFNTACLKIHDFLNLLVTDMEAGFLLCLFTGTTLGANLAHIFQLI